MKPYLGKEMTMNKLTILFLLFPVLSIADIVVPADKVENSVNIRLNADTGSDVVGELHKGESLTLVESIEGWHEVRLEGGSTGFISSDWSRVEGDPVAATEDDVVVDVVEELVEEDAEVDVVVEVEEAGEVVEATVEEVVEQVVEVVEEEVVEEAVVEEVLEAVAEEPAVEPVPEPMPEPVPEPAPEVATASSLTIKGDRDFVAKIRRPGELGNSQIFDDGNSVGIGTTNPEQRLEVNGSIQIHDQNSSVAGLMITQSDGDTGYIMHNRANTLTIGAGSIDRITIDRDGNVGIGASRPEHPLEMASGAHVTSGGAWTNRSSRDSKENIAALSSDEAVAAVMALQPVSFNYVAEQGEGYVGFIAEDVPALLAKSDRASLSTMDIVAALTKVVQEQQRRIDELEAKLGER